MSNTYMFSECRYEVWFIHDLPLCLMHVMNEQLCLVTGYFVVIAYMCLMPSRFDNVRLWFVGNL